MRVLGILYFLIWTPGWVRSWYKDIFMLIVHYLYPFSRLASVQNQLGVFRTRQRDLLSSFNLLSEVGASTLLNTSNDHYALIRSCISASRLDVEAESRLLARLDELTGVSHSNARSVLGSVNWCKVQNALFQTFLDFDLWLWRFVQRESCPASRVSPLTFTRRGQCNAICTSLPGSPLLIGWSSWRL